MRNILLAFGVFAVFVVFTGDANKIGIKGDFFAFIFFVLAIVLMVVTNAVFRIALNTKERDKIIFSSGVLSVFAALCAFVSSTVLFLENDYFVATVVMVAVVPALMSVVMTFRVKDHVNCSVAFYFFMATGWLIKIYF